MRQEERRAKTFAALAEAAAAAFASRGYDGTSLDAIAASVDLSKGAVYTHFQAKLDLFLLIVQSTLSDALERLADVSEHLEQDGDLTAAPERYLGRSNDARHVALIAEIWRMATIEPRVRELLDAFRQERLDIFLTTETAAGKKPGQALERAIMAARLVDARTLERRLELASGA